MEKEKTDIVLAKKSGKFMEKAGQLGFQNIVFALPYGKSLDLESVDAITINTRSLAELRKQITLADREKKKPIIIANDSVSRAAFENNQAWMIVMPELNHVLCNLAVKNNIIIGIDFSLVRKAEAREKAKILEKIIKMARLCRKYKTKVMIATFSKDSEEMISVADIDAFAASIGIF